MCIYKHTYVCSVFFLCYLIPLTITGALLRKCVHMHPWILHDLKIWQLKTKKAKGPWPLNSQKGNWCAVRILSCSNSQKCYSPSIHQHCTSELCTSVLQNMLQIDIYICVYVCVCTNILSWNYGSNFPGCYPLSTPAKHWDKNMD